MTNEITITAEQVKEMLSLHMACEYRLNLELSKDSHSDRIDKYRAECIAVERMLDIIGIEW